MAKKSYRILKKGEFIQISTPGKYAGYALGKIFETLNCKSGKRMKKSNRVFFHTLEDAISQGYRPCKNCHPITEKDFQQIQHLIPQYSTLQDFYDRDKKQR